MGVFREVWGGQKRGQLENAEEGGVRNKFCGSGGVVKEWLTSVQAAGTNVTDWVA